MRRTYSVLTKLEQKSCVRITNEILCLRYKVRTRRFLTNKIKKFDWSKSANQMA